MAATKRGNDAVLYVRVSTKEQAGSPPNLQNQTDECNRVCELKGIRVAAQFVDPGESAWGGDRPEFRNMIAYCKANRKVGIVVVQELSRFSRDVGFQATSIKELRAIGVSVRSFREPPVDDTPAGIMAANLIGSFNQFFSDALSIKMADRCRAAIRNGRWPWKAPTGYRNVKAKEGEPNIVPDPLRAHHIRRAFELVGTGQYKPAEVLRLVTEEGLTSRSGRPLDQHTFMKILRSPVYMGLTLSKTEPPHQGLHEPLVSEGLFNTVQDVLAGRRRKYAPHRKINPAFPLKGIRCIECNSPLTAYYSTGKMKKHYAYYECKNCGAVLVRAEDLEAEYMRLLQKLQPRPEVVAEFPRVAGRVWLKQQGEYEKRTHALTKQLETQKRFSESLMEKWLQDKVNDSDYQ